MQTDEGQVHQSPARNWYSLTKISQHLQFEVTLKGTQRYIEPDPNLHSAYNTYNTTSANMSIIKRIKKTFRRLLRLPKPRPSTPQMGLLEDECLSQPSPSPAPSPALSQHHCMRHCRLQFHQCTEMRQLCAEGIIRWIDHPELEECHCPRPCKLSSKKLFL